jgi:glycosyltransferase involved in cell wall biosynthesis
MKILFLARSLDTGGAERQLGLLASGLHRRGHDVAIAVFYGGGALEAIPREAGVRVMDLHKRGRWDVFGFGRRALHEIRRFRPDVVHGYLVAANLLAVAARPFVPGARTVWGLRASEVDWSRYDRLERITFQASQIASRFADVLIVNSEAGARYHAQAGFPEARLRVVPNGVDLAHFRPDRARGAPVRASWGFTPQQTVYGIVARLDPLKDHETFLAAAARVAAADPAARFVIVGDGPEAFAARLRARPEAVALGDRLRWAGGIDDMPAAYNALDVAVLSSTAEGFPNAVAEAMACGIACAVTNAGDAAAIVGDTGAVAPVKDVIALAEAMRRVARSGRPPVAAARARIEARYSAEAMCLATETVLSNGALA